MGPQVRPIFSCQAGLDCRKLQVLILGRNFGGTEMVNEQELNSGARMGRLVAAVSVLWWVATIGGIIWVISANS
jgi:hypothetical protein